MADREKCLGESGSGRRADRIRARYGSPAHSETQRQLDLAKVQQLEIFTLSVLAVHRIFISLAQETHVVGRLEVLNLGWISSEFLVVSADRAGVLHSPMNHLLFPIAPDFECDRRHDRSRKDDHQGHNQRQRKQDIAALVA